MKKWFAYLSLVALALCGLWAVVNLVDLGPTYDGSDTDVTALYQHPDVYDVSDPDGVAEIIIKENLDKTRAGERGYRCGI